MTAPTRFLVVSDTHGHWPFTTSHPAPPADVFLHCGDLTQVGGLPSLKRAFADIKKIDAPLKLVIAGNHDLELDQEWVRKNVESEEDLEDGKDCLGFAKAQKAFGIRYLEEGVHEFKLQSGKILRVYASSYTPEFYGYAFAYAEDGDRFNPSEDPAPKIDVVMTHGPPSFPDYSNYKLDVNSRGRPCGCEKLENATRRMTPKLHCFGHIHEGRGAMIMSWIADTMSEAQAVDDVLECGKGNSTLFLNAARFNNGREWLVDIDL
jgi:hypothetical protein